MYVCVCACVCIIYTLVAAFVRILAGGKVAVDPQNPPPARFSKTTTPQEDGVWVSAVSGVPLFDAGAKYNSGTGWPSFFQPIDASHIIERVDPKDMGKPKFLWRVEVLDRKSGTHLGHVFNGTLW